MKMDSIVMTADEAKPEKKYFGPSGKAVVNTPIFKTYEDHRMAMSLALVGLRVPGVTIKNPDCTQKTYPNFFQDLDSLRPR